MHRGIAAWLTAHPERAVIVTAALGALSPSLLSPLSVFAAGIPVLMGLERGRHWSIAAALAGTIAAIWVISSLADPLPVHLSNIVLQFFAPVLLGMLLGATGSMNLCFQVAVLVTAAGVIAVHAVLDDPVGFWVPMVHSVIDSLTQAGIQLRDDPETATAVMAKVMWGAFAALVFSGILSAVWLGRWWQSLLHEPGSFGREFQQLRMGKVLGLATSLILVLALWVESDLLNALVWVAFTALSLQGLAAAHRSRAHGTLNRGWLAAIYVLLIVPLSTAITVLALAVWGFADNWTRTRAQQV